MGRCEIGRPRITARMMCSIHRHRNGVDRIDEIECRGRLHKAHVEHERRPGHPHQKSGNRRPDELEPQSRYAGAFGRHLIVADGREAAPGLRALDPARHCDGENREQEHHEEQELDVVSERLDLPRPQDVGAGRATHVVPVDDQRLEDDGEGQRRDGEEHATQPERQVSHAESEQAADHPRKGDHQEQRRLDEVVEHHGAVRADREESGRPEIHVAHDAAHDVPGGRERPDFRMRGPVRHYSRSGSRSPPTVN